MRDAPEAGARRRRLCMVVHAYYPLGEPRVQREARAAVAAGWEVTVLCLRESGAPRRERVDGVDVRRLDLRHVRGAGLARIAFEYLAFTLMATLVLAAAAVRRRYEVVHVHNPPDFLVLAGLLPKLRGARLILDIHDLSSHMYGARFEGRTARVAVRVLELVERAACAVADHVVTVHEPYKRELASYAVDAGKVTVVMNAVDDTLIAGLAGNGAGPAAGDEAFELAYHGTLTEWYGVDLLLEGLATLRADVPRARAVVLGDGDALPRLRTQARELGLAEAVEFSGRYMPIAATLARVATAQCGVIPNRPSRLNRFALSSKLFEYVALGVPVVVSRLETLAAHFSDEEVTFFEPGDAASLAAALRWVAEHRDQAAAKAARAKERAEAYSWREHRERYLALLPRGQHA